MKRATLKAYPTTSAAAPSDLTDRLLAGQTGQLPVRAAKKRAARQPVEAPPQPLASVPVPTANSLDSALAAVATATAALQQAGQDAPARYDVALRFRLDALAHHLQQVKDFVAQTAAR